MDPQRILEQLMGSQSGQNAAMAARSAKDSFLAGGHGTLAGGLAAGGLLGLLIGNKKARKSVGKFAGGAVAYGGAAALGALAYRAYQNWQTGQHNTAPGDGGSAAAAANDGALEPLPPDSKFLPQTAPAEDGRPFELALVMAMITAANADGHIGPDERATIFDAVDRTPLEADEKALIFDALRKPMALREIAALAAGPEQAAELYLASRLAIDPDHPAERAYLEALAGLLSLPSELVAALEAQAAAAAGDKA